jgi:membrane protease YdiL (CAAX protease family)
LQWAVALDTMVLSLMLCTLREYTGAIWAGVLVHAIKNGLAFYLLFINPNVIDQLQAGMLLLL